MKYVHRNNLSNAYQATEDGVVLGINGEIPVKKGEYVLDANGIVHTVDEEYFKENYLKVTVNRKRVKRQLSPFEEQAIKEGYETFKVSE